MCLILSSIRCVFDTMLPSLGSYNFLWYFASIFSVSFILNQWFILIDNVTKFWEKVVLQDLERVKKTFVPQTK